MVERLDRRWEGGGEVLHCCHATEGAFPAYGWCWQLQTLFVLAQSASTHCPHYPVMNGTVVHVCLHVFTFVQVCGRWFNASSVLLWRTEVTKFCLAYLEVVLVQICSCEIANYKAFETAHTSGHRVVCLNVIRCQLQLSVFIILPQSENFHQK